MGEPGAQGGVGRSPTAGPLDDLSPGKKGADIQKKKEELFVEAQKRFGKDPKTLAKVKAYIEAHTPKG